MKKRAHGFKHQHCELELKKTIKRLETELKWLNLLQYDSLSLNDNIHREGNMPEMLDFDVFLF